MGRTVPSFRQALERELDRLQRLAEGSVDPRKKAMLLELLKRARDLENEYAVEAGDPNEEMLLSMLLYVFSSVKEAEGRGGKDEGSGLDTGC
jgi:hypothetical protein